MLPLFILQDLPDISDYVLSYSDREDKDGNFEIEVRGRSFMTSATLGGGGGSTKF